MNLFPPPDEHAAQRTALPLPAAQKAKTEERRREIADARLRAKLSKASDRMSKRAGSEAPAGVVCRATLTKLRQSWADMLDDLPASERERAEGLFRQMAMEPQPAAVAAAYRIWAREMVAARREKDGLSAMSHWRSLRPLPQPPSGW